jgi:acyl transferase domain-containing protein
VGRCKTFDASADGYGRGEAIALALLQRPDLVDSSNGARHILSFVHGSAVNQDGRSSGLTAPNGPAQTALVRSVLAAALAAPQALALVSLHGTGAQQLRVGVCLSLQCSCMGSCIRHLMFGCQHFAAALASPCRNSPG